MDFFDGPCYAFLSGTMESEERDELQRFNDVCDRETKIGGPPGSPGCFPTHLQYTVYMEYSEYCHLKSLIG
jgi:hypothetical protein